jgi:membrane protein DedA with SNARE-associated domain
MTATATAVRTPAKVRARRERLRTPLLWLAAFRLVLGIVAIPLAPGLFRDHFVVLVLLRPTKEVLLAGGFLVRQGDVSLLSLTVASVPLLLFGVWHFFALGRLYADDIERDRLPKPARRLLPRDKIRSLCKVLAKRGAPLVVLTRLAVVPSTVVAAAAGASDMTAKRFLAADGVGGLLSFVEVVGAGYALGEAYEEAGPWLTGAGVVVLLGVLVLLGRRLRRD